MPLLEHIAAHPKTTSDEIFSKFASAELTAERIYAKLMDLESAGLVSVERTPTEARSSPQATNTFRFGVTIRGRFEMHKFKVQQEIESAANLRDLNRILEKAATDTDTKIIAEMSMVERP